MTRFKTLLLREWMQHRFGWLVLMGLPFVLFAAVGLFGQAHVEFDDGEEPLALTVAGGVVLGVMLTTLALAWGASLLQTPGLARRDVQDRSIEFWLSLPAGHAQSIAATLLAHLILLPVAALGVGLACGVIVSLPVVTHAFGVGAWLTLPWVQLLMALVAVALRVALGIVLATLWLSPLILVTMAASAWLKRWGVPAVAAVIGLGGLLLDRLYGNPVVWNVLGSLVQQASRALFATERGGGETAFVIERQADVPALLSNAAAWCALDAGHALVMLASPAFLAAAAVAGGAFALLVLRRQRGA
jgi:ABC-2 type transport system permease protein